MIRATAKTITLCSIWSIHDYFISHEHFQITHSQSLHFSPKGPSINYVNTTFTLIYLNLKKIVKHYQSISLDFNNGKRHFSENLRLILFVFIYLAETFWRASLKLKNTFCNIGSSIQVSWSLLPSKMHFFNQYFFRQ